MYMNEKNSNTKSQDSIKTSVLLPIFIISNPEIIKVHIGL